MCSESWLETGSVKWQDKAKYCPLLKESILSSISSWRQILGMRLNSQERADMVDRETVTTYSEKAGDYAALGCNRGEQNQLNAFLALLPAGGSILDLGCGPGFHAEFMMNKGFAVRAMDATPAFIEAAQARGVDAALGHFDDLSDVAAYDGIWANFSLLHAPKDKFPHHLAAIHLALKPHGMFYLGLKLGKGEKRDSLGRFYAYFEEVELRDYLQQAGFTNITASYGEGPGLTGSIDKFIILTAWRA